MGTLVGVSSEEVTGGSGWGGAGWVGGGTLDFRLHVPGPRGSQQGRDEMKQLRAVPWCRGRRAWAGDCGGPGATRMGTGGREGWSLGSLRGL